MDITQLCSTDGGKPPKCDPSFIPSMERILQGRWRVEMADLHTHIKVVLSPILGHCCDSSDISMLEQFNTLIPSVLVRVSIPAQTS